MAVISDVQTRYGSVLRSDHVSVKRGWARSGDRTIPLTQIASVKQDISRRPVLGFLCLLLASAFYPMISQPVGLIGASFLAIAGAISLWGSPTIVITTTGGYTRRIKGTPWSMGEADRFVSALRYALFDLRRK